VAEKHAPGTLPQRVHAGQVVMFQGLQWLETHEDETLDGFLAWLNRHEWKDNDQEYCAMLKWAATQIGMEIWRTFEILR